LAKGGKEKVYLEDSQDQQGTFLSWVLGQMDETSKRDPSVMINYQMSCKNHLSRFIVGLDLTTLVNFASIHTTTDASKFFQASWFILIFCHWCSNGSIIIMHKTSISNANLKILPACNTLFDLAARPQYIQPLRDEIQKVFDEDGYDIDSEGFIKLKKTSLTRLKKLDSFMKESQRLNSTSLRPSPSPPPLLPRIQITD